MAKPSKRVKQAAALVDRSKAYEIRIALGLVKKTATAKFDESIDVAVNLGIDSKKSDQVVRGSVVLPRSPGKTVGVVVFTEGANIEKAKAAGADIVGFDDLAERIKGGVMDFDVVIATPDAMKVVGPLGQVLGPRGLMPNPKVGTVTPNVEEAVRNAKGGQVQYRADKAGIVQCTIGGASCEVEALETLETPISAINKAKPSSTKGIYLKKVSISRTMGVGIRIDQSSFAGGQVPATH
jgi:large subunit ribosomal protein L1